jgi:hypothetical protein
VQSQNRGRTGYIPSQVLTCYAEVRVVLCWSWQLGVNAQLEKALICDGSLCHGGASCTQTDTREVTPVC